MLESTIKSLDRIAGIAEGPAHHHTDKAEKTRMVSEIAKTMPPGTFIAMDADSEGGAIDAKMIAKMYSAPDEMPNYGHWIDIDTLRESIESYWENRNQTALHYCEMACAIECFADPDNEKAKQEIERLHEQGCDILSDLGLQITDQVVVIDLQENVTRQAIDQTISLINESDGNPDLDCTYAALRENSKEQTAQIHIYCNANNKEAVLSLLTEESDIDASMDQIEEKGVNKRAPGFSDGKSYLEKQERRQAINEKIKHQSVDPSP